MGEFVFHDLTAEEAEHTIAQIWLSIERFGFPPPHLSFEFQADEDRLSLSLEFEGEGVAMMVVGSLSSGATAADVQLGRPPMLGEEWQKLLQESVQ